MSNTTATNADKPLVIGGVELGGTTIRVVVAHITPTNLVFSKVIDTATPDISLPQCVELLKDKHIDCLGIGSFGPVDLNKRSATYGSITSTPKKHWTDTPVVEHFKSFNVPTAFTTDVNGAAMGEALYGEHGADIQNSAYVTVGTGIGAGIITNGQCVEGLMHPEAGHVLVRKHPQDEFAGLCPFHTDCCEGLATANAIAARLNIHYNDLAGLADDHAVWDMVAYYLAQLCVSLTLIASPQVIVLGGGVLKRLVLYPLIRQHTQKLLAGYVRVPQIVENIDSFIKSSRFDAPDSGMSAGIVGVLTLAHENYKHSQATNR